MSRGIQRERNLRDFLELCGWVCIRVAGSLGPADLVAIAKSGAIYPKRMSPPGRGMVSSAPRGEIILIQVKGTARPFQNFGPAARDELLTMGNGIGASCWVAHKPLGARHWDWHHSTTWPSAPAAGKLVGENLAKIHQPSHSG